MTGVTLIKTPRQEAREAFLAYRRAFRESTDAEQRKIDEALMKGYRAIAAGQSVIDLHETFKNTRLGDDNGYPKLAICRAHEHHCTVVMGTDGSASFYGGETTFRRAKTAIVDIPSGIFPTYRWTRDHEAESWPGVRRPAWLGGNWRPTASAIVPLIPPQFRPPSKLEHFHVLWEAEWAAAAPHDPLLLRHLGGALYAVLAQWDLTPLERAVLAGRLR